MEDKLTTESSCYVFDASSLIELEGQHGKGLKHMPDRPGKWLVVPSKVAREVNSKGAPADTTNWLRSGKLSNFNVGSEGALFMKIRIHETLLSDADIQGIVIAYHRKGTYVVEEAKARTVARSLRIRCLKAKEFRQEVQPPLPGF